MHRTVARTVRTLAVAALVLVPSISLAQGSWREVFREHFGEDAHPLYLFGGVLEYGPRQDTPFVTLSRGGYLQVINETDSSFIRYYFLEPDHVSGWFQAPNAAVRVSVDVAGEFGEFPGAGLVYRVDPNSHFFYAFVLTGGSGFGLYKRDASGYYALFTDTSSAIVPGSFTRLSMDSAGSELRLYLNGAQVASYMDADINGIGVGILAAGTGAYYFDDFTIELSGP